MFSIFTHVMKPICDTNSEPGLPVIRYPCSKFIVVMLCSCGKRTPVVQTLDGAIHQIERFSYDLEMKMRKQNRNNKRTGIERFDWFIGWIQTYLAFGWLS